MRFSQSIIAAALTLCAGAAWAADGVFVDAATVRQVQKTLDARGYRAGMPDGRMGMRTERALRRFQKDENLQPTGRLNGRTLAALGMRGESASAGASRPLLLSHSSATVRDVQRELRKRGYYVGAADGVLGEATRAALTDFQRARHLSVNGRPDRETLAALGVGERR